MRILVTASQNELFERYFPGRLRERLEKLGEVEYNPFSRPFTREELKQRLKNTDIAVTHWGCPQIDAELLDEAPGLRLLAHAAGTVAHIASEAFYERGIPVISANSIMARYVAETTLAYILGAGHMITQLDGLTRAGRWQKSQDRLVTLFGNTVGIIGFGSVARELMPLLEPFGCTVKVYDPYLREEQLQKWPFAERADFPSAMSCGIVTIHAAQTPETYHMVDAGALARIPDGGILVNTSRGSLIDISALIAELKKERIYAVLDVYEKEGEGMLPRELCELRDRTMLLPHIGAATVSWEMTEAILEDIERFLRGEDLKLRIPLSQYRLMTQE